MRRSLAKLIVLSIPLSLFYYGCFDKPGDVVAPSWDVNASIPIVSKTYTLKDVIEKDTSFIKWYPAGSQMENQLYYADKRIVTPVTIGDKIKLDNAVSSVTSQTIGDIKIQDPPPISASQDFDFVPNIKPNTVSIFPPFNDVPITVVLPQQDQFEYLTLSGGSITLSLQSSLPSPLDLQVSGITLTSQTNNTIAGTYDGTPLDIPAGQSRDVTINLKPGVRIYNQLAFSCKVSTPGSGLTPVIIPQTVFKLTATLNNLSVSEVNGKLKGNTITTTGNVEVDPQTKYSNVELSSGALRLSIRNNIDVAFTAKIKLNNLYSSKYSTTPYEMNIRVERNSSQVINQPLSNFVLKSSTPTSNIDYQVTVATEATTDYRKIQSTNSFTDTVNVSQLSVRQFSGIVKPTKINIEPTSVSLNLKDIKNKFKFGKIVFKNPDVKICMKPSAQLKLKVYGEISAKGYSNTLPFTGIISRNGSQVDSVISIPSQDLANFLSSFSPNLPDELYISGSATVNPDFDQTVYSIASTDSVTGFAEIKFPLNVGVDNGTFADTTDYDIKDIKNDLAKIQSVLLTLEVTNGLAANVRFTGALIDPTKTFKLLDLLPNRQPSYMDIPAAQVNSSGQVTAPSTTREVIELKGSDIEKFLNGKFIASNITLNTSGATAGNPIPVEFKITDAIKVKAYGKVVYKVSPDENK